MPSFYYLMGGVDLLIAYGERVRFLYFKEYFRSFFCIFSSKSVKLPLKMHKMFIFFVHLTRKIVRYGNYE